MQSDYVHFGTVECTFKPDILALLRCFCFGLLYLLPRGKYHIIEKNAKVNKFILYLSSSRLLLEHTTSYMLNRYIGKFIN